LSIQIHAALLALHTSRPVKMVYNRQESFTGHVHRHPARIHAEHHATRDGRLVCVKMQILLDGGAYASSSTAVTANATSFACGPYDVPNALIETTSVFTNNPPCGAMRGFGAVQTCFAAEAQMDKLARALDLDPVELRLLNALAPGDTLPTGQVIDGSLPVAEVIRRCAALPEPLPEELPRPAIRLPGGAGNTTRGEGVRRGRGFAVGFKNLAYSEGFDDSCAARVRLFADGSAEVHCAAAEVGQGVTNVILQVARTELGTDDVRLAPGTTAAVGSAGSASASRMTWMAAGAVRDACQAALAEREARGGTAEVDVERGYRHRPGRGPSRSRRVRVCGDEGRRRGGRGARADADRLDRDGAGRREGDQPTGGRGPDRGRHGPGDRPRPDGGDPDARRRDHERELHRLPHPDRARRPADRGRARRGSRAGRAVRREGRRRAAHGRLHGSRRGGPARRDRQGARPRPRPPGRHRRADLGTGGNPPYDRTRLGGLRLERGIMRKRKHAFAALVVAIAATAVVLAAGVGTGSAKPNAAFKVAWIYVGPHNDGGWSQAHDAGRLYVQKALGSKVQTTYKENIAVGAQLKQTVASLVNQGYKMIFGTSYGYFDK